MTRDVVYVTSWLDYCNALLTNAQTATHETLQGTEYKSCLYGRRLQSLTPLAACCSEAEGHVDYTTRWRR